MSAPEARSPSRRCSSPWSLAAGVWMFTGGDDRKTLVAHFPRTISLYEGSDVRVLGVAVGTVDKITPSGTDVVVEMSYDEDVNLPEDAEAVIIAPSIVGDRYVQITPVYTGGDKLPGRRDAGRRGHLGPARARPDLLQPQRPQRRARPRRRQQERRPDRPPRGHRRQLRRPGRAVPHRRSRTSASCRRPSTDNKEELFGSAAQLEEFISTLAQNDTTVRSFNQSLSDVSTMLDGEKEELAASLQQPLGRPG